MRAPKTYLRAALVTGILAVSSAAVPATMAAAHAETLPASAQAASVSPLMKQAASLPKVSPQKLLTIAQSQVGVSENANGGGTKFHEWYMKSERAKETVARDGGSVNAYANAPWCDMFVSWVGEQAGLRPVLGWDAYTVQHAKWFQDNHRWGNTPQPGAVVFFDWHGGKDISGIDHVGFVIKDNGDGTIKTVEGNTGNGKVEIRTRPMTQVTGFGYPVYTA
ncbi:CHAP domain-containing protein [Microtetraspora fusca]|uniref:CHAP domain-containing protein n=1 Tax=Microtetraspora fusca TaxID=1997 RepID=A0ABW6VFN1_MICFU|nr:CHAP domain-containing protein [Microtetraspora fusca]